MASKERMLNTNGRVVSEILTNYRDTFKAFTELINNSLQVGATEIRINITKNKVSGVLYPVIDKIELLDNGKGVSISDFDIKIFEIGTTIKPGGHGIGRFSALQIGESMHIETVSFDETLSKHTKISTEITASALKNKTLTNIKFPTDEVELADPTNTFYKVTISDLHQNRNPNAPKNNKLSEAFLEENLPGALAQYYIYEIFNENVNFFINGKHLRRDEFVIDQPALIKKYLKIQKVRHMIFPSSYTIL